MADLAKTPIKEFAFHAIFGGFFAVDTFFTLSGFLVTYLFIKEMDKKRRKFNGKIIFMYYFHRLWRLTPYVIAIVVFYATILPRIRRGPGEFRTRIFRLSNYPDIQLCQKYWWRTILYINNLFKSRNAVKKII